MPRHQWDLPVMRALKDNSGSVAPLFALALIAVLGTAALAIDYGRGVDEQSKLQAALDAAVLAGARSEGNKIQAAEAFFAANVTSELATSASASFSVGARGEITGTASANLSNYLAGLIGHHNTAVGVVSVAASGTDGKICILLLDPNASQALLVNGGAQIDAPDCEVHTKSNGNPAAVFNAGTDLDTKRICIESGSIIDNGGSHPNLETSCATASDPFAGALPVPSVGACNHNNAVFSGAAVSISPGVYCGWTNFNAGVNVNLQPGLYIIKNGGWNANGGNWTGTGVTFYFDDTSMLQFNSGVKAVLTPPDSGAYEGIMFFERVGLAKTNFPFDDSRGFDTKGLVYLPSRNLIYNGGTTQRAVEMTIVANTMILNQTKWTLTPDDNAVGASGSKDIVLIK
jgi:Flp pilus assembly protein TadG